MVQINGVGLNPAEKIHYLDHLAVVCHILNIPLLFQDEADQERAIQYYPEVDTLIAEYQEFTPEFLIANYDVIFTSDLWNRHDFHKVFRELEMKYNKQLRAVYCPHGFSDKGYYLKNCVNEDITFIYGQNMLDLLDHHGALRFMPPHVITGNYRYTYFQKFRDFYDKLMQEEILAKFDQVRPTILYAPTWGDEEDSGTFCEIALQMIEKLPSHYNMIVKPHPLIEHHDAGFYYQLMSKCDEKLNTVFLKDFPLVFPVLANTDIYIGDMSSIGYDFLIFDKPMFFLNKNKRDVEKDRGLYLYRCGVEIQPEQYNEIYEIIEKETATDKSKYSKIRQETWEYTFGAEKPFPQIRNEIIEVLKESRRNI